jgi:hypothetical protein
LKQILGCGQDCHPGLTVSHLASRWPAGPSFSWLFGHP